MEIDEKDIGRRVRTARRDLGLTQEKFAELIGVSPTHISHIENAKGSASLKTVIKIMNVLDITPNELFCGVVDNSGPQLLQETAEILKAFPPSRINLINRKLELEAEAYLREEEERNRENNEKK